MPENVGLSLKPVQSISQRVIPDSTTLEREYASTYLEKLGVETTSENVDMLLKELPIGKALVLPVWSRGQMAIFPGLGNVRKSDVDFIVSSMYKPKDSDDGKPERKNKQKKGVKNEEEKSEGEGGFEDVHSDKSDSESENATVYNPEKNEKEDKQVNPADTRDMDVTGRSSGFSSDNVELTPGEAKRAASASAWKKLTKQPEILKTQTPQGRKISWATVNTLDLGEYTKDNMQVSL